MGYESLNMRFLSLSCWDPGPFWDVATIDPISQWIQVIPGWSLNACSVAWRIKAVEAQTTGIIFPTSACDENETYLYRGLAFRLERPWDETNVSQVQNLHGIHAKPECGATTHESSPSESLRRHLNQETAEAKKEGGTRLPGGEHWNTLPFSVGDMREGRQECNVSQCKVVDFSIPRSIRPQGPARHPSQHNSKLLREAGLHLGHINTFNHRNQASKAVKESASLGCAATHGCPIAGNVEHCSQLHHESCIQACM